MGHFRVVAELAWQLMATNGNLTPKQRRAIAALLAEPTIEGAAKNAGIGERTLHRWLDNGDFCAALNEAQARAIDTAITKLAGLTGKAVETLRAAMADQNASQSTKIRAADICLARLFDLKQLHDFEQRIAALEAQARKGKM